MSEYATVIAVLGHCELGLSRLGFGPKDSRPVSGVAPGYGPRYSFVLDDRVALYSEEIMAGLLNLEIEQGATFAHVFRWQQHGGTPVDLTGAQVLMQVRTAKSTTADHVLTLASYAAPPASPSPWRTDILITPAEGKIAISTPPVATSALTPGSYWYDLKVTFAGGEVYRLVEGRIIVDAAVSA